MRDGLMDLFEKPFYLAFFTLSFRFPVRLLRELFSEGEKR